MKTRLISLTALLLTAFSIGFAQTANDTIRRTVLVESVYNPVLASSEKRSFLPDEQPPVTNREAVVYADQSHDPGNLLREPFGSGAATLRHERLLPAYLRLGYGTRNNADVLGLYRVSLGRNDALRLGASITGWNTNIPYEGLTALPVDSGLWKSRRYDTYLHIGYAHEGRTRFGMEGDFGYYTRNFLSIPASTSYDTDTQNSLSYGGSAYLDAPLSKIPASIGLKGGFHRWQNSAWLGKELVNAENHAELDADFVYRFRKAQLNIGLTNDLLHYQNLPDTLSHYYFGLHPQWVVKGKQGSVALGFNMDVQPADSQRVQFSPNCLFTLTPAAPLRVDLAVDGGRDLHTFQKLYQLSPWWAADVPLPQAYTYLNTRLHAGVRVAEGFHLGVSGGYRITHNALFAEARVTNGLLCTGLVNHDANVWHVGADMSYEWKDLFRLTSEYTYYGWTGMDNAIALLAYAPQMDWNTNLRVRLVKDLHADATFRYRRFCDTGLGRQPDVADLSLKADYRLHRFVNLYVSGENLLNRQNGFCPVYPAQGIRVVGGVVVRL